MIARRLHWALVPAAGIAIAGAALLAAAAVVYAGEGRPWPFDLVVGLVVLVTVLLRRRLGIWSVATAFAVSVGAAVVARYADLPSEPGAVALLGLLMLAGWAVRTLPGRQAGVVAVVGFGLAVLGLALADPLSGASEVLSRRGIEAWPVAVAVGLWMRLRDDRAEAAVEAVRRDERLALARDLHDVVAHHVAGIVLQAQGARLVGRSHPERLEEALERIETAGSDSLVAMRRVVGLLRDDDDAATTGSGLERLTELVRRFEGHGPAVQLSLPEEEPCWPPEITTTVYRIVQESLTNIARHATRARTAVVEVAQSGGSVSVRVSDDAPQGPGLTHQTGGNQRPSRGVGLIGMRERVEALGGTLDAGPETHAGWSVTARLPNRSEGDQ